MVHRRENVPLNREQPLAGYHGTMGLREILRDIPERSHCLLEAEGLEAPAASRAFCS